ncbi:MAG: hypothetical protein ACO1SV_00595 [Fimbriimonas sp.]
MAFDIYVGPVSRYSANDWKSLGQLAAEAHGIAYQVVRPNQGVFSGLFAKRRAAKAYERWHGVLRSDLEKAGTRATWNDAPELPYFTERPGWEGYASLLGKYAHLLSPGHPEPVTAIRLDALAEAPAYDLALESSESFRVLAECMMWIPGSFPAVISTQSLSGETVGVGSIDALERALDDVCRLWGKDRDSFANTGFEQPGEDSPFEEAATYGLATFSRMAREAKKNGLPMILDF